ncbi:ABC transporter permease [Micromonospora arida]
MFLAIRELSFARLRFALMGAVIALIAVLMVMLSGLSVGLVRDGVSGLQNLPVTSFAFAQDVQRDSAFSRSVVDLSAVDEWDAQPGIADAAPFGNTLVNTRTDRGTEIDLALFGVQPDSFLSPSVSQGERLGTEDGIVVSPTALDAGLQMGDTVTIDRLGTRLRVVGVTKQQDTFGHVDVAYVPLAAWQAIKSGTAPGTALPQRAATEITAVAVRADDGKSVDLPAGDTAAGTESLTLKESYGASPGYTAETTTLQLIQGFLYAISALVAGAFFAVWAIQRKPEVAVLRALGASTGWVLRDALTQALVLLAAAVAIGVGIGLALGALITGSGIPFALSMPSISAAGAGLVVLGLVGAGAAVIRITSVDPATALGGNR